MITDIFLSQLRSKKIKKISDISDIQLFKSGKFTFKIMAESDLPFFNETRNDAAEWLHNNSQHTLEECETWFCNNRSSLYFMVFCDQKKLGYFRTSNFDFKERNMYVGADFHKHHQGQGYAIPAYRAFFKVMHEIGFSHFYLEVLSHNDRALHVYKKLGFKTLSQSKYLERADGNLTTIKMEKYYVE